MINATRALIILLACFSTVACQPAPNSSEQDGLLYCSEGNPESFNPQLVTSGTTLDMTANQLYDRLIEYDVSRQVFVPSLAKSWSVSEDGLVYAFTLREDVQFHSTSYFSPSRLLTSEDVLFSFSRWFDEQHPYHAVSGRGYPFFTSSGLTQLIDRITTPNAGELVIYLSRPDSSFLANLASDFAIILSAEYADYLLQDGTPELLDQRPIGTGPFQFSDFRKDMFVRFQRNNQYWREPAQMEQIVFRIIPSDHKRMLMLLTGDCDISPYPPARDIQWLENHPQIKVQKTTSPNTAFWALNTTRAPFDDPMVRQALAYGIDREAILNAVYFGHAILADSILPASSWAHTAPARPFTYDPDRAQALLRDAGYPNGFSMTLWAMPVQRAYNPNARLTAERIQSDLSKIGIQASIISYEWSTFRRRLDEGEHDSVLIGWSADHPDPDNFFRPLLSCTAKETGSNRTQWCDPMFDQLLQEAITSQDPDIRKHFYAEAQHYLRTEIPLIPFAHGIRFQALRSDIHGAILQPFGSVALREVYRHTHKHVNEINTLETEK